MAQDQKYERFTIENKGNQFLDPFVVYGWSTYGKNSVLAGQPQKVFLDSYETSDAALKEYPQAAPGSKWTDPQVSLNHLPDENDPVAGGMYPDDYDDNN